MEDVTVKYFKDCLNANNPFKIIDVREPLEFHTYNIGGINIPLGKLTSLLQNDDLEIDKNEEIIVICQRGLRSKTAKYLLENAGYSKVSNLIGGLIKFKQLL